MREGKVATEPRGQSAFRNLQHGFAIRGFRDMPTEQNTIERQYRRCDNSDECTSRIAWSEWALESDLDYKESALRTGECFQADPATPPAAEDNPA